MTRPLGPGATIGVLGSGQLGRMLALAAREMGYRVATYSPESGTPTGQVADIEVVADYRDLDRVRQFARSVAVVTLEFENVPVEAVAAAEECITVRPSAAVLGTTQQRVREKTFLAKSGFPVARFAEVKSAEELKRSLSKIGVPAVLKTAGWGYDGKGQAIIQSAAEADAAWRALATDHAVLEQFVRFDCELSVIVARGHDGAMAHFGPFLNAHANHILDTSTVPAGVGPVITCDSVSLAEAIAERLELVGVLCVEMFLAESGELLVNELAPRPHNSGHLTIDACATSQFEQQVRTACGLPLGSTELLRPAAMANLLGDRWAGGEPCWARALALPGVRLHLYGKAEPRPARKMGHLTALAATGPEALALVQHARDLLRP